MICIRKLADGDIEPLFALMEREGEEWRDYWHNNCKAKYLKALENSITYLIFENDILCGFARCRDDDGYGIYVCDLLVDKEYRGKEYGRMLMEQACAEHSGMPTYVMSDVDEYYEKLGYERMGSIFKVRLR